MQGTDWTVSGSGTFATSASVDSGRLAVNGTLTTSALSILSGGVLGGTGLVAGAVTNGGTIAPGNSIGTLTMASVLFSPNSLFLVEIDPSSADKLVVTGTATIDPTAKVSVMPQAGVYTSGMEYLILDAGTRSGEFGGIVDNSAFLDFTLDHAKDPNQVWLTVSTVANFVDVAETPNQKAAAGGAQELGSGNPIYDAIVALDADTARNAFDQLSGEIHPSAKGALLDESRFIREAALDRMRRRFDGAFDTAPLGYAAAPGAAATPWPGEGETNHGVWGQVFGSGGTIAGDGNAASLGRGVGGLIAGIDGALTDNWRFGIATGLQHAGLDVTDRMSTGTVDSYHLAGYGGYDNGAFAVRFGGALTWNDVSTRRDVAFPGFTDTLTAAYQARTEQFFGEVATTIHSGDVAIEPFAGAAWVAVDADGFTETGGAAALTEPASSQAIALASLGVRFDRPLRLGEVDSRLHGMLAWQHASGDLNPTSSLAFAGGTPFAVAGAPLAPDVLRLDLGLEAAISRQARASITYSGQIGAGVQDHGAVGRLAIDF